MTPGPGLFEQIKRSAQESFADFVHKRAITDDPQILTRWARTGAWKADLLRLSSFLSPNNFRVKGKRFVFLNSRLAGLAATFANEPIAMIGGPADWRVARTNAIPFCFSGDLFVAAFGLLFGKRWIPGRMIVSRWLRFFAQQQSTCYLVVANDTMPLALLLVQIARRCSNVVVVCVEHGLVSAGPGYEFDDVEGRNSHVNLVYSETQRLEMERRVPGMLAEVMGFPDDFAPLMPGAPESTVVLVGVGTFEDLTALKLSLEIFAAVGSRLELAGFKVEYRPHPSESGLDLAAVPFPFNRQKKSELLAGKRKAFIGFGSTLLYEAEVAGHAVFVLDDVAMSGYSIADFGFRLDTSEIDGLGERIRSSLLHDRVVSPLAGVRQRFEKALARAMARLGRGSSI